MNLEKNYTNCKKNVYIDAGNQLLKIGYADNGEWIIKKIPNSQLDSDFSTLLSQFNYTKIYWCSVCKDSTTFLKSFFNHNNIPNTQIAAKDFNGKLLINPNININEVGVDILAFSYYIKLEPKTLGLSFGTATVAIYYNMQLEGAIIGSDFINSYDYLNKILGINNKDIKMQDDFGTDTIEAINGAKYFMINGFINELLNSNATIEQIIISGGNRRIFDLYKNKYNKKITIIDEIVLKGLFYLIESKKY